MSGNTTSDDEGSQEDPPRYDIDDLEIIKTIGKLLSWNVILAEKPIGVTLFYTKLSISISNFILIVYAETNDCINSIKSNRK